MNSTTSRDYLKFDKTLNPNNYKEDLTNMVVKLKSNWPVNSLKFSVFSGGLANKLIGVSSTIRNDDDHEDTVLLCRIFGASSEKYINREAEINTMQLLHELKIGPKVYCRFNNGIIYEYINGDIVNADLVRDERVYSKIAEFTARFHKIDEGSPDNLKLPILFNKINEMLNLVPDDYKCFNYSNQEVIKGLPTKTSILREVDFMKDHILDYLNAKSKINNVVFSHNDLLFGNIIYNLNDYLQIWFIDHEFCGYNYQAYDIANHFNEFAGIENVDYCLYPSKEYQCKWIGCYLRHYFMDDPAVVTDDLIEDFYRQVCKFALVSHLFWAIWSLIRASCCDNNLKFDFVNYAQIRFNEYFKRKYEFVAL